MLGMPCSLSSCGLGVCRMAYSLSCYLCLNVPPAHGKGLMLLNTHPSRCMLSFSPIVRRECLFPRKLYCLIYFWSHTIYENDIVPTPKVAMPPHTSQKTCPWHPSLLVLVDAHFNATPSVYLWLAHHFLVGLDAFIRWLTNTQNPLSFMFSHYFCLDYSWITTQYQTKLGIVILYVVYCSTHFGLNRTPNAVMWISCIQVHSWTQPCLTRQGTLLDWLLRHL